uniref:Uncharacterized protein n=1 Tax=Knipowitschia caucasica TaxID=637954 RepID=A0AAV2KD00_KNICA
MSRRRRGLVTPVPREAPPSAAAPSSSLSPLSTSALDPHIKAVMRRHADGQRKTSPSHSSTTSCLPPSAMTFKTRLECTAVVCRKAILIFPV